MRKSVILLAFCALILSGCDFVRTLAGCPTSAQLEKIRKDRIAAEQAAHQARLDSMERAEKELAEAIAAREAYLLDSLAQAKGTVLNPSKLGGLFTTKLDSKYYIVVGAFRTRAYAERKLKQCNAAGYKATIISFRNGLLAVGVLPSNDLDQTVNTLKKMRGTEVCPKDGWILMNI